MEPGHASASRELLASLAGHERVLVPVGVAAMLALVVLSIIAGRRLALALPADMFVTEKAALVAPGRFRPLLGVALVALGLVLLVLPGPGVLVIVAGLLMLNASWRHRLLRLLVGRSWVLREVNSLRHRHGRPEIVLPPRAPA